MDQIQYHYIGAEGQQLGPVGTDGLMSAVSSGVVTPDTLVWQPEWTDWRPASSVPGLFNNVTPPTFAPPRMSPTHRTPWGVPAMPAKFYPPGSFMTLYWWWLPLNVISMIVSAIGLVMMLGTNLAADQTEFTDEMLIGMGIVCGGALIVIPSTVLICFIIYRSWRQIQDGHAETGPGKAVGFNFIPFFNIYWQFVMYWGLAKDLRSYAERYGVEGVRVSPGFTLGVIVTATVGSVLAGCLGLFGLPVAFVASVLMMVLVYQIVASSRAIAEAAGRGVGYAAGDSADPSRATLDA